jgi:putative ABC transport system substrate-binding protein
MLTVLLTFALLAAPLAAEAQPGKGPKIGFLGTASPTLMAVWLTAFRDGLRERGWVEGQNITIEYRWGEGKPERFPGLAAELVGLPVDIIVTSGSQAVRAAQQATGTIPIVMAVIQEPVGLGLVQSLARPGGNTTGLSFQDAELSTKRLELLRQVVPKISRVAVLWDPTSAGANTLRAMEEAAPSLGLRLQVLDVHAPGHFESAFKAAERGRAQALVQVASPFFAANRRTILELAARSRLPATCQERTFVVDGCLMAYGPSFPDMFRRAAYHVDKILNGAKPADLPVEQASKFELVINLKTAKALRLTIPASVLARADEIIE